MVMKITIIGCCSEKSAFDNYNRKSIHYLTRFKGCGMFARSCLRASKKVCLFVRHIKSLQHNTAVSHNKTSVRKRTKKRNMERVSKTLFIFLFLLLVSFSAIRLKNANVHGVRNIVNIKLVHIRIFQHYN